MTAKTCWGVGCADATEQSLRFPEAPGHLHACAHSLRELHPLGWRYDPLCGVR
jgi:hypothetical protein